LVLVDALLSHTPVGLKRWRACELTAFISEAKSALLRKTHIYFFAFTSLKALKAKRAEDDAAAATEKIAAEQAAVAKAAADAAVAAKAATARCSWCFFFDVFRRTQDALDPRLLGTMKATHG
jgi:hypothetical protein